MLKLLRNSCLIVLSTLTISCASDPAMKVNMNSTEKEGINKANEKVQVTKEHMKIAEDMQQNVTTQNSLEATISSLATQMMQNNKMHTNKSVLITSFVRLDNFKKTTEFGRVISESLINELSNRGFNIIEFRGQLGVSVNAEGEYFITRNTSKMKENVQNSFIVVGTYSRQYGRIMLNARVLDNSTGQIITSARSTYVHGLRNDCVIFKDCKPPRTIKIMREE